MFSQVLRETLMPVEILRTAVPSLGHGGQFNALFLSEREHEILTNKMCMSIYE